MLQFITEFYQNVNQYEYFNYFFRGIIVLILYIIYLRIFKYYPCIYKPNYNVKLKNIGRTIPPFPNGWYTACKSKQLQAGKSLSIDLSGHNITIFRNKDGKVYALHSYCAHLGANLGIGGKVVNNNCIQCPFHGWLYDGQTGNLVDHDNKPCSVNSVQYKQNMGEKGCKKVQWNKQDKKQIRLRKYHVRQINGFIYLWLHVDQHQQPTYQIIDVTIFKIEDIQHTIHAHCQDLPQNGADIKHFKFIHPRFNDVITFIELLWKAKWIRGDDPDLPSFFQHKNKKIRQFKQGIYNNLIKDYKYKEIVGVTSLENDMQISYLGKFFVQVGIAIQIGPGLVFIFLKSHIFTIMFIQYIQTKQKYKQVLYHQIYINGQMPYFGSAICLHCQGRQVYNDSVIWQAKKFGYKISYKDNEADSLLLKWRQWYSQFYEGCKLDDDKDNKLEW